MNSLFVISLPRSLSSLTYYIARRALGLKAPSWTSDGEILNVDRFALYQGPTHDTGRKFIVKAHDPPRFQSAMDFLDEATVPEGFAYKDVIHPFVVAQWLKTSEFRVLRIKRNLTDVVFSMLAHKWFYPRAAAEQHQDDAEAAVIEGIIRADMALDDAPGERIDFDDLVSDERVLRNALLKLYPSVDVLNFQYLNEAFCAFRDQEVLQRRKLAEYQRLDEKVGRALDALERA
ncbi:MAG: hypothetical protein WCF57_06285 [Pyrinomonadaceae bacterium]